VSKKLEEKRARRLEEERRKAQKQREARRRSLMTTAIALLVAAIVVFLIVSERQGEEAASNDPLGVSLADAGCKDVETFDDQGQQHIAVGEPHAPYNSSPPTSGPHYETPAQPNFYPAELPTEQVVHNLEHGQIVIWYSPDLPDEDTADIEDYVERENDKAARKTDPRTGRDQLEPLIAVPFTGIEDGSYAMTSWTNLQTCDTFSSAAVDEFRVKFQSLGPEQFAAPFRNGPTAATPAPAGSPEETTSPEEEESPSS
jgi:hypothetical protein